LANIGGIIEESVGRDRAAMKLIAKVIPNLRHYIQIAFGISKSYYGGEKKRLAGTGQGNRFSGNICRDSSYLIIKEIEKRELGIMVISKLSNIVVQKVSIAFADDTDLMIEEENAEEKMKSIVKIYNRLYSATGRYIEEKKSKILS